MKWTLVKVAGKTLTNPDGTVRTLNPSDNKPPYGPYYWTASPPGTTGQYELCAVEGNMVSYNPTGAEPVVFGFKADDPVASGFAAISVEPL